MKDPLIEQGRDDIARRGVVGSPNGRTRRMARLKAMSPTERRANRRARKAHNAMMHRKAVEVDHTKRLPKKDKRGAKKRGVKCKG